MITCFGDLVQDVVIQPHGALQLGSDVTGQIQFCGGGSASNTAAWLGVLRQPVTLVARIGRDESGRHLEEELQALGVQTALVRGHQPTGAIAVLVDLHGERTMVTQRGANLYMTPEDLGSRLPENSSWLHCTGYSFYQGEDVRASALSFLQWGWERSLPISVDPSSYALLETYGAERFLQETRGCRLCLPNREELFVLTGQRDPRQGSKMLLEYYDTVVVTLGEAGCLAAAAGEVVQIPAPRITVKDTVGAGDAFNAGILAGLQAGKPLTEAASWGMRCAAQSLESVGGRPPRYLRG